MSLNQIIGPSQITGYTEEAGLLQTSFSMEKGLSSDQSSEQVQRIAKLSNEAIGLVSSTLTSDACSPLRNLIPSTVVLEEIKPLIQNQANPSNDQTIIATSMENKDSTLSSSNAQDIDVENSPKLESSVHESDVVHPSKSESETQEINVENFPKSEPTPPIPTPSSPNSNDTNEGNPLMWLSIPVRTYMHEYGHSLAFSSILTNAQPSISLNAFGFMGGSCSPNFSGKLGIGIFSTLGQSLESLSSGAAWSTICAAGPLVDVVSLLALSKFSKTSKEISFSQRITSNSLLVYAASALVWDKKNCGGHDFCNIWASSGFFAYSAAAATCLATFLYVNRRLHPSYKRTTEAMLSSLAMGGVQLMSQSQFF